LYLQRTPGYKSGRLVQIADMQRVDLGIAMCHFELVARERGLAGTWVHEDPSIAPLDKGVEHIATWRPAT